MIDLTDCYAIAQISIGICTATQISQKSKEILDKAILKMATKFQNRIDLEKAQAQNELVTAIKERITEEKEQRMAGTLGRWVSIYTGKKKRLFNNNKTKTARRYNNIVILSGLFSLLFIIAAPFFKEAAITGNFYTYSFALLATSSLSPIIAYILLYSSKKVKAYRITLIVKWGLMPIYIRNRLSTTTKKVSNWFNDLSASFSFLGVRKRK